MILGIDIGGTKTAVCAGTREGEVRASRRMPTQPEKGAEDWLERLDGLVREVLEAGGLSLEDVEQIGVSAPGPLSVSRGLLLHSPNMTGWKEVPVVRLLDERFGKPVRMNNDANAGALAEWLFGAYRGTADLLFLTMSTGLGAGIITGGRLLQGANDLGGEVGFHVLDLEGPASPAGHRGSFEAWCGGKNLADRLRRRIVDEGVRTTILDEAGGDPAAVDFRSFVAAVKKGDAFALAEWETYLERLAQGIGNLVNILNPELVLLGTIAVHTGEFLLAPLRERLRLFAIPAALEVCRLEPCSLGERIGDLAALAVAAAP